MPEADPNARRQIEQTAFAQSYPVLDRTEQLLHHPSSKNLLSEQNQSDFEPSQTDVSRE
ncbi:MAG: hypothetical protein KME16_06685 [Scytolyngbya sp. HA4215-MV1]|jgi:hypothetical protein|nr:hypothetical protein [Scytolyngbya sp. HA4215-MV1]